MSCEHCWGVASMSGEEYRTVLQRAEDQGWPCTKNDVQGAKLRAGQFWDEATQTDRRKTAETSEASEAPSAAEPPGHTDLMDS